ncbi:pyridoxal-dependent decarboxylase [Streptacidiphilus pinicola]|uniref:Pyridoxal-dependent decarboxylase n=1 Tax=Streptacidiphilus pinicola TaxID=2219663 RepID=A0A2X0I7W9_9ACTN|nr:aspartate aminotransferase family protein [Streptacidiphilus pinicola]RAG80994.1 pyridoxal-dependent decarboxylase [Streptacidiphilus pinicola]
MRSLPQTQLFNAQSIDSYRELVCQGAALVARHVAAAQAPFTGVSPRALAREFAPVDLDAPLGDADAALDELDRLYLRDAVWFHHPRYLAHLNCPVVLPALLGETVLAAVNSSLDTWDQSAGGTLVERRLIEWTAGRIGLGPLADGVFTSGGTQSNLHALLLARDETLGGDLTRLPRLRILASEAAHFSVVKSARLLGLGAGAAVAIPADERRRMDPEALERELEACRRAGELPMAVVATAGTTDFGSIDPLPAIADVCARHGVWLHVDAAYGCGLLVSPTRRDRLTGIEHADSVTVDFHKSFFQPVSSSALLVRDAATLRHAGHHADYLNPKRLADRGIPNQVDKSLQTTRRFDALKLWLTLRIMGADGVGALFDSVLDLAAEGHALLARDPRFQVVVEPQLSTLVFRWQPPHAPGDPALVDAANLHAREALAADGAAVVAGTVVDGRHHLKFTLLNPATTRGDLAAVLDLLDAHATAYLAADQAA